jgi:hypothetical protein
LTRYLSQVGIATGCRLSLKKSSVKIESFNTVPIFCF